MLFIVAAMALWCAVSVLTGLALGRVLSPHAVRFPTCPPDARDLFDVDLDVDAHTLAAR